MTSRAAAPPVAIVTGASQGIGAAAALKLVERGFAVGIAARRPAGLVAVQNRIQQAGGHAFVAPTDVTEPGQVGELVEETTRRLGPVELLVNAAGAVHRAPLTATSDADFEAVVGVNLKGAFLCTRAVLPGMIERRRGRIVNLAAMAGRIGAPRLAVYCASKWGVLGLTKACAEELRPAGISVFAVCPGSVDTESYRAAIPGAKPRSTPDAVAEVIAWLGSEAPSAMTGSVVDAPG
jgi:NAD(P)-dependent dehydrogenase (short-subunit alcohol dehydrogenase family)